MGSMARILVDDIEFIMVCSVCLTCRFSVLSEYIFVFWDSSNQDRFHWTGEHFSAADMRKTSSASSTDSSYLDHYSFGNLPTFASTKRNSQKNAQPNASFQNEASFYNLSTNSATPNKVELPFVPSKNYPINKSFFADSRKPSTSTTNNNRQTYLNTATDKLSRNFLFGRRVWSGNSDRARIYTNDRHLGHSTSNKETDLDPQTELYDLLTNFGSLLYLLISKGALWVLWILNQFSHLLLNKVRTIPSPNWNEPDDGAELVAESTPRSQKSIFQPNALSKHDASGIYEVKNPLFQKKLQSINNDVNEKLLKEKRKMEKEERVHESVSLEELALSQSKTKEQYGTFFFNSGAHSGNKVNLELSYLKAAMNTPLMQEDKRPQNVFSKSSEIKENMLSFFNSGNESSKVETKVESKPTFTRSTNRFKDLEWLVDDKEDYLNNLESTKLFKEYQKIIAERKTMQQLLHLSTLKEHGLGVRPLNEEQAKEIEKVWMYQPEGVLMSKYGIKITSRDLLTLSDRHWLNDNVIDFYLQLVKDYVNGQGISKIHVFSTFFYTTLKSKGYTGVRKWAKRAKVDVSELDYIFVPVNLNQTHWALAVVDNVNERFEYIDSLYGDGSSILHLLLDYMTEETKKNHGDGMNGRDYVTYDINGRAEGPGQQNGFDCGVFTCTAVDYLSRNRELDYSQADMPSLRRRMAWEVLKGRLLDH